jgi:hypothetical protein
MGTKSNPTPYDCYKNAEPDEPLFVLLGRDVHAARLVRQWADTRAIEIGRGLRPVEDLEQVKEAIECADAMQSYQLNRVPRAK